MMKKKLNRYLIAGCIITGIIVLWILVGHFYTPYPPTKMSSAKLQAPSAAHLFGTDKFGRDIFSRVMQGSDDPDRRRGRNSSRSCDRIFRRHCGRSADAP